VSATLFIELTDKAQLEEWLPKLVGIETEVELRLGPSGGHRVRCRVDEAHLRQLTREEITASVHYLHFELDADEVGAFAKGPVILAVTHPAYPHEVELPTATRAELLEDLRG
ncbi:MAG: DUF3501 family protein, partial [Acidimicrobiales bacterium]